MIATKHLEAYYGRRRGVVTVTGVADRNVTVRVLLNPVLPEDMSDDQIFESYAQIEALDKKEERNAGRFSIDLNSGYMDPPYLVVVALSDGTVLRPPVEEWKTRAVALPRVVYSAADNTITVTGVAGANDTVRVLLNPTLPAGMGDDEIFDNYPTIPALDKKEKPNAGSFVIILNPGTTGPEYSVVIVTSAGDVIWPFVEVALGPAPP